MDLLDFHQYDQDHQDHQDFDDLPDLPPFAPPLQRQDHWEPDIPMMSVSELKERLSAAMNRTNTPLASNETRALRVALDGLSEAHVRMNDDYPVPPILSRIEAIPLGANRGFIGNGGRNKKRSYRNKRGGSRRACMRSSYNKRSLKKRTLKKRYF